MNPQKVAARHTHTAGQWLGPLDMFLYECLVAAGNHGFGAVTLGLIGNAPLVLLTPPPRSNAPKLLVAAGFHGNEPAGCWGILEYLKSNADLSGVSFLPAVNPTGLDIGIRYNCWNEVTNGGFCGGTLSQEGKILLRNLPALKECARDGFLTLHEDEENKGSYLYTFGNNISVQSKMLQAVTQYFPILSGKIVTRGEKKNVKDGIVRDDHDGSFEDLLSRDVPISVCTEVPAQADKMRRNLACKTFIETFINEVRACKNSSW